MTKTSTKRAMLGSAISLLLCFAMLVGTTFAWFTDNVTSTGNRIIAGDLEIDLLMYDENDTTTTDKYVSIAGQMGDIFSEAGDGKWEPGKTQIVYLAVENSGSLALKYNIILDIVDKGLIGSLEYAIVDGATATDADVTAATKWADIKAIAGVQTGDLVAGKIVAAPNGQLDEIALNNVENERDYFALAVHMKEEAGNEYEKGEITIDVLVNATQVEAEEDSFGPDYDKDAEYTTAVDTADALATALAIGGNIEVIDNITLDKTLDVGADVTASINLNGNKITAASNGYAFYNQEGGTLTFNDNTGNGVVEGVVYTAFGSSTIVNAGTYNAVADGKYVFLNEGGTLTVNEATINGGSNYPLYSYGAGHKLTVNEDVTVSGRFGCINTYGDGVVVINGGSFTATGAQGKTHHCVFVGSGAELVINDGTFAHNGNGISDSGSTITVYAGANGGATINGGTFTGGGYIKAFDKYDANCYFVIKGGTFSNDPSKYVPEEGYNVVNNNDGTWTVTATAAAAE